MTTPWSKPSTTKRARRSESKGAALDGGRRVAASGSRREKGDYRSLKFRVEDKFTDAASFTLKLLTLKKIEHEAVRTPPGLLPMMRVTIQGETFRVMREQDFLALYEANQ